MHIRRMAQQDLDSLLALASRVPEAPQWTRTAYEEILANGSGELLRCCWVATRGEALLAFAVTSWLRGEAEAEVESLVVDEEYRRQGVGSALIGVCMAWAATAGAPGIRLEVRASNAAALALYRRRGFEAAGVRSGYYAAPVEDAVILMARFGSRAAG